MIIVTDIYGKSHVVNPAHIVRFATPGEDGGPESKRTEVKLSTNEVLRLNIEPAALALALGARPA